MISNKRIAIKFVFAVVVVVLCCLFVSGDARVRCIESEREALLSFKNGLIDTYGSLSSWRSNECCEWDGVKCSKTTGHVVALQCDDYRLQGEIASSLLELHRLIDLDLSGNDFGGIPIPKFIGSMKQLQLLNLGSSNFSGTIPPELGNLTNLLSLDLFSNSLASISAFTLRSVLESLETLDLSDNQLNGSMPDTRAFPSLTKLHLSGNNFTGPIPLSIGQLSKLQVLDLSYNSLTGLVPLSIGQLSELQVLHLSYNSLTGSVPLSIGQLSELQDLDLSYNTLEGIVSESHFIKLDKLKKLDLSFNPSLILDIASDWIPPFQLSRLSLAICNVGPYFPNWIRTQTNLTTLDLRGANITDEAPRWLWSTFSSIQILHLSDNQISGPIPLFPVNANTIRLSGNMFTGSISSICKTPLSLIYTLSLSNNQLAGEIPDCWEQMPSLHALSLANNHFSGEIPRSLGALHDLQGLQLHGKESEYWNNLGLLKLIDLSSNGFTGNIPKSFSTMRGLRSLNLSRNSLTGHIIPDIGQMEMLDSLDLSHNQLSGKIPTSLTEIHTLGFLDLSNNKLSGKIPTGTQLQSFNASSYADNDGLCGDPLPKCPGDSLRPSANIPRENMNENDGNNFSFMQEVGISMGFVFGMLLEIGSMSGLLCLNPNGDETEMQR
ncbi:receptor-like protein EIX2 [Salvia divinorum]|uniref:Receptor-like protein EIX2 n=1 Tax=Salvia divinorum TaxID=28513 RepID=A0ABD1HKN7_SALDI